MQISWKGTFDYSTQQQNNWKKHPEDDHHEECQPLSAESVEALQIDRDMRSDVRKNGKRPRDAYMDAVASIPKKFKTSSEQQAIVTKFPTFNEVRSALYKHHAATHVQVQDPYNIPDQLRATVRGNSVNLGDANYQERFLLYAGQGGKLQIFGAASEIELLYGTDYIVCDGTFEMAPQSAYQLYTLHGFFHGEGLPLVWGLLPNKSKATYKEFFEAVKNELLHKYGELKQSQTFVTDFEAAAIEAIKETFPQARLKGCTFHFRQALMRRATELGLRLAYSSKDSSVQQWIRQIMGLTLLPEVFIPFAWNNLKNPPMVEDVNLAVNLLTFATYFERTWISGIFEPKLWSHYDNTGPRTTNLAEGWHNSMNHSFGMPHPSACNFLHWLHRCQYEVQCRGIQLASGRPPKKQLAIYRDLDARIASAKLQFGLKWGFMFLQLFANPDMWMELWFHISTYLRHVSYLIAGKLFD